MDFARILKTIIEENEYTQKQVAEKIGVKQSQISEWLSGKAKPGYDTLKAMTINLPVTAEYLLGLEDETGSKIYNNYGTHNGNVHF